ncbi:MAG: ABC transporter substrate-binding protein [Tepidiformaceae bacterium]
MARDSSPSRLPLLLGGMLAVLALAGILVLVLRAGGGEGVSLPQDRTYTEGVAGTWQRINPLYAPMNEVDADLAQLVFAGLTRLAPDGTVLPGLAELPEISADGRSYTFRLRNGLEWHDGAPLTSRDVAFTIATLTNPDSRADAGLAEGWLGVELETPDPATVVFRLKQPSAPFLARNTTVGILPEHLLANVAATALYDAPFNTAPVGAGPYRLDSLNAREAVLTADRDYHLGQPGISSLRLRFFTDYPTALRAFQERELDGLLVRDTISEAQLTGLQKVKGVRIEQPQRAAMMLLYLNNDLADTFADERVRRAISIALDRQAIVDRVYHGLASPSSSPVAPGTWAYARQYDVITPAQAEARSLLEEAGWKPHPTTGILINKARGEEFRFTIRTDNDPIRLAVAKEVAAQLEPLGIRATVASTTFAVLLRDFLQERKYEAAIAGWDQGADPDLYSGWHSSQLGVAGRNIANFADQVADRLIEKARTSTDTEVRKDQYRQLQEVWQELGPSVVIAYPRYTYAHTDDLKGRSTSVLFSPSLRFADILNWKL